MAERKIILNLAMSLDGYICDPEGGFAWISGQGDRRLDTVPHYDIEAFARQVDAVSYTHLSNAYNKAIYVERKK